MSYKKSKIYRLGLEQALLVEVVCKKFPKHEQYTLSQQIRKSSRSIVANYVESYVRQKYFPADYRRFLTYSQGSCDETKYWVELAREIDLLDEPIFKELMDGYEELGKMIFRTLNRV